jgi:hypothetical protein
MYILLYSTHLLPSPISLFGNVLLMLSHNPESESPRAKKKGVGAKPTPFQ